MGRPRDAAGRRGRLWPAHLRAHLLPRVGVHRHHAGVGEVAPLPVPQLLGGGVPHHCHGCLNSLDVPVDGPALESVPCTPAKTNFRDSSYCCVCRSTTSRSSPKASRRSPRNCWARRSCTACSTRRGRLSATSQTGNVAIAMARTMPCAASRQGLPLAAKLVCGSRLQFQILGLEAMLSMELVQTNMW